jgi:hypothetical protein
LHTNILVRTYYCSYCSGEVIVVGLLENHESDGTVNDIYVEGVIKIYLLKTLRKNLSKWVCMLEFQYADCD